MAEFRSIYPELPAVDNSATDQSENIPRKDKNSNFIPSNIPLINEENHESTPSFGNEETPEDLTRRKRASSVLKDFFESFKSTDLKSFSDNKKRQKLRNEINDTFILNTGTDVTEDNIDTILNRGDFFVARRIWDKAKGQCHDHFVFVSERRDESLDIIHVSDISPRGSRPTKETWGLNMLKENLSDGAISLMKFSFLDFQDDVDEMLERAIEYEIPKDEVRSFHYACSCAFGAKMPIYSAEQLPLCNESTLLLFTKKKIGPDIIMLLHSVDDDGKLNVSLSYDSDEVKSYSKEELFEYKESQYNIYYFPDSPIDPSTRNEFVDSIFNETSKKYAEKGTKKIVKKGIKHGLKETLGTGLGKSIGRTATGPVIDLVVNSGEAGVKTYQSRKKEQIYEETGGVSGFSRTQSNKKITQAWTKATAGTAGGIGTAAALASGAAVVGQIGIPIPFVGAALGVAIGAAAGGAASGRIGSLVSSKIYNKNMETKCLFCQTYTTRDVSDLRSF